jgi:Zn-dependent protease
VGDVDWGEVALLLAIIVPSVILHEVSHGVAALRCGDDTAKRRGRLTLNPLAHVDPFGTVLLPLVLALSGFGVIGYAKPVPVNLRKLRHPRNDAVWVSLAGPATNIAIALVAAVVVHALGGAGGADLEDDRVFHIGAAEVAYIVGAINLLLAAFNLLPLPPLDGSAVVERALPRRWLPGWTRLRRYSLVLVLGIVVLMQRTEASILDPVLRVWEVLV